MKIVFATLGSLGDLHPCLALASELLARGHRVCMATNAAYRLRVESLGIEFQPMRPDWDPAEPSMIARCANLRTGPEVLLREIVLPQLNDTYNDLLKICQGADLLIAGEIVYAAPLVAEKLALRWVSLILSPLSFLSAYDPSLLVTGPELILLRRAGWRINRAILKLGNRMIRDWWAPVRQLRAREGLRVECEPLTRDKFSPELVLALFSRELAQPQPDWPIKTFQPGFVFDEQLMKPEVQSALDQFFAAGEPPVVFAQGSTAVAVPGQFYEISQAAARRIGRRSILLGAPREVIGGVDSLVLPYAPYSAVFSRCAAIVHQGGSGTTGRAMQGGKPQLIVPFGWDQPDNGLRIARAGAGLSVARKRYSVDRAAALLRRLLGETSFSEQAVRVRDAMSREEGTTGATLAIERLFHAS